MNPFQYVNPRTADSAVAEVADKGRFLAGGIDVLGEMKEYIAQPRRLVNVKELPGTRDIARGKEWTIGANVTIAELEHDDELKRVFPGLQQAAAEVGSPQIRNVATVGGNLAQHSRCWYYRHRDIRCLKKGGDTCYAREGENKYHSLFSGNPCISPVVSNLAIALARPRCESRNSAWQGSSRLDDSRVLRQGMGQSRSASLSWSDRPDSPRANPGYRPQERLSSDQRKGEFRLGAGQLRGRGKG